MQISISALIFITISATGLAQVPFEQTTTSVSNVEVVQTNFGTTCFNNKTSSAGLIWPRGSTGQFIFGGGVWLGGKHVVESVERKKVVLGYNPDTGVSWFTPLYSIDLKTNDTSEVLLSTFDDHDLMRYEIPIDIAAIEGYPMGLEVSQELQGWAEGELKDVVLLTTSVICRQEYYFYTEFILAYVLDMDIGRTTNPMLASSNDACELIQQSGNRRIFKAYSNGEADGFTSGVMGIALVNGPGNGSAHTAVAESFLQVPQTTSERYDLISSGQVKERLTPGDLYAVFGTAPEEFFQGKYIVSTLVLMFGESNTAENDQRMINIVNALSLNTSVDADDESKIGLSVYPNPVSAGSFINIICKGAPTRVDVLDAVGRIVLSVSNSTTSIDVTQLSNGNYTVLATVDGKSLSTKLLIAR